MIKQLSLFGEEPVEAPKKAPVNVVETTKPKPYRLVPPTNIIEDSSDTKSKKDTDKEGKAKNTPAVRSTLNKEKKEKKQKIESAESSSVKASNKPTTDANKLKAISLDLFADMFSEPLISSIPETKESLPSSIEKNLSFVIVESLQEEDIQNINKIYPESKKEIEIAEIQELVAESITEVVQLPVEPLLNAMVQENMQEIELEDISAEIHETEQVIAKSQRGRQPNSPFQADVLLIDLIDDKILFSKQYYAISEVAAMFNVKVSLLRFWENEFDILKPRKNRKGDRLFRPEDVKNLKLIYFLLREKKYTIEGAKIFIKKGKKVKEKFAAIESLKKIKGMLMELKASLSF
jgi:DNA-binding transcriptional MerR regulator